MRPLLLSAAGVLTLLSLCEAPLPAVPPLPQPATLLVYLPANSTLTIDDQPTTSTSAVRRFVTPPLEPGKTFHYTLTAQATRGGQTVTVRQKVQVRAGEETTVSMRPTEVNEGSVAVGSAAYYPPYAEAVPSFYPRPGGAYPSASLLGRADSPHVSRFSEQSPAYGAGPPGSYARWATGSLVGR